MRHCTGVAHTLAVVMKTGKRSELVEVVPLIWPQAVGMYDSRGAFSSPLNRQGARHSPARQARQEPEG